MPPFARRPFYRSPLRIRASFFSLCRGRRRLICYQEGRGSPKLDLALPDGVQIELFSFPDAPKRSSYPEACGLRHLAFEVVDLDDAAGTLVSQGVFVEEVRVDALTGKRFTFFFDPDGLPLELYEAA